MQRFTCNWLESTLVVLADGKVVCGCADPNGERPLGNLKDNSILEIWNSEKVRAIRRGLNQGYAPFCLNCGLKQFLPDDAPIPQQPEYQERLTRIFLEPTVVCNISCFKAVCNMESGIVGTRERKMFPIEQFMPLIDEIGENLVRVDLFNYGDPFVHPKTVDMVEYIKKKFPHVIVYASTNGLLLTEEKIKRLVAAPIDEITFSVDGPDHETYVKYRRMGDFGKVFGIMKRFVEERNKTGREVPFINWRYILFKWNDSPEQMAKAVKLAEEIGVDRFSWEITDHPPEAQSEKYQIGSEHWKKIYYDIWDTSQVGNAIPGKRNVARIKPLGWGAYKGSTTQPTRVRVKVKNVGGARWPKEAWGWRRSIRLGAQLYSADRQMIEMNYARAFLPQAMTGGEAATIEIELPPWKDPGRYQLKFDMACEGIDWFEKGGSPVVWKEYVVS